MLGQIFNIVAPIFLITFTGVVLGRIHTKLDTRTISTLVLTIATPALVFSTMTSFEVHLELLLKMGLAAALCVGSAAILALPILILFKMPFQTFLPALTLPNSGNLGLPLVLLAFGERGLVLGISYFSVVAMLQYTVGAAITSGQYKLRDVARQPLIWSILLVMFFLTTGLQVPAIVAKSAEMLGGMMIPAMLIMLGISLVRLSVSDLRPALLIAILRLVIGITVGITVIRLLALTGIEAGTVFLLSSMPTAIVSYVFAERYRPDAHLVAGAVVVSTLGTFCLLPAIIWVSYWISDHSAIHTAAGN